MIPMVVYDCESFLHDWIVDFKDRETKKHTTFHNDPEGVMDYIRWAEPKVFCGFNTKSYDIFIIRAIMLGYEPEEVNAVSQWIVAGNAGWQYEGFRGKYFPWFPNIDIMDDMQIGLSLKAIEGHLGMDDIKETEVDFNITRKLTEEELTRSIGYCQHDVDATDILIDLREDYLQTKLNLAEMANIDPVTALGMTNAKLTAKFLRAKKPSVNWADERNYKYPDNLRREFIPQEVFEFFDRLKDDRLSDEEVFSSKLEITIGECPVTLGYGGIHGAIPNLVWEEQNARTVENLQTEPELHSK